MAILRNSPLLRHKYVTFSFQSQYNPLTQMHFFKKKQRQDNWFMNFTALKLELLKTELHYVFDDHAKLRRD